MEVEECTDLEEQVTESCQLKYFKNFNEGPDNIENQVFAEMFQGACARAKSCLSVSQWVVYAKSEDLTYATDSFYFGLANEDMARDDIKQYTKERTMKEFTWVILDEYPKPLVDIDYDLSISNSTDNFASDINIIFSASLWKTPPKSSNQSLADQPLVPVWNDCDDCVFEITVTRPGELCSTDWVGMTKEEITWNDKVTEEVKNRTASMQLYNRNFVQHNYQMANIKTNEDGVYRIVVRARDTKTLYETPENQRSPLIIGIDRTKPNLRAACISRNEPSICSNERSVKIMGNYNESAVKTFCTNEKTRNSFYGAYGSEK